MITKNWCKKCFKSVVDDTAADRFLLMSKDIVKCPSCGRMDRVVVKYYKYGEHEVTPDGLRNADAARHIGVDMNKSYWKEDPVTENGENNVEESDTSLCTEN